jgi:hypothetical protein
VTNLFAVPELAFGNKHIFALDADQEVGLSLEIERAPGCLAAESAVYCTRKSQAGTRTSPSLPERLQFNRKGSVDSAVA